MSDKKWFLRAVITDVMIMRRRRRAMRRRRTMRRRRVMRRSRAMKRTVMRRTLIKILGMRTLDTSIVLGHAIIVNISTPCPKRKCLLY